MKQYPAKRKGPKGSCLSDCLAALLHNPETPDFAKECEDLTLPDGQAWQMAQEWLIKTYGCFLLEIQLIPSMPWNPIPKAAFCIFFGTTKSGVKHAVVGACDDVGFAQVWNPDKEAEIESIESIGFLVPRDPSRISLL